MTRYTVVWYPFPEDKLLRIWLAAADRQSITDAADSIDRLLATVPAIKGEIVDDDLRELEVPPLRVLYAVSEADCMVKVHGVTLIWRDQRLIGEEFEAIDCKTRTMEARLGLAMDGIVGFATRRRS